MKFLFLPTVVTATAVIAIAWFGTLDYSWTGWAFAGCYPGCFCEAFHPGGIVQPLSAYSNLFYIFAGLVILAADGAPGWNPGNNLMSRAPAYRAGFGATTIAIGLTSLFYHVSLTQAGRWLDYMGMYAFVGFALLYGLARLLRWSGKTIVAVYAILLATLGLLWVGLPALMRDMLGGLILAVVVVEIGAHWIRRPLQIRTRYLSGALGIFLAAFLLNMLDESGALCQPDSLWQWHAVWHFLTAGSTVMLFLYFQSEEERKESGGRTGPGPSD
jgi:hypothetical protein